MTAPDLTPAPHELAHLAHTTTGGRLDETQLVNVLLGAIAAGMPWLLLLGIVWQLIRTADGDIRNLETQRDTWIRTNQSRHPQGARP